MNDSPPDPLTNQVQPDLIENAPFSVSARVALQLGRESISSSVTAVLELVKNAYDADASVVRIRFANLHSADPMMLIEDDGRGMSASELVENWMVIGTSNKVGTSTTSGRGRVMTGEKGLGRLGLDRLCRVTRIQSMVEGAATGIELVVDWTKYEDAAKVRLEAISHPLYRTTGLGLDPATSELVAYPKGTRLVLERLRDVWHENALEELHAELSLLVSPFKAARDFRVELDTGGAARKFDGPVSPDSEVLDHAFWRVAAEIHADGGVSMKMTSKLHEMGFYKEKVPWTDFAKNEGESPKCGPLQFDFYFFLRGETNAAAQPLGAPQLRLFLKSNQGIRIYRDGFRVKPYGEPSGEGDWLRLAYRRTVSPEGVGRGLGGWRLGYNQVVGAVFLSRHSNGALIDQTNREGLVVGDAFRHLRVFALKTVEFFERNQQEFIAGRAPAEPVPDASRDANNALEALKALAASLKAPEGRSVAAPTPDIERVTQTIAQSMRVIEENAKHLKQVEREKDTLANLASLGILAASFGHETLGWATSVMAHAGWLDRHLKDEFFMINPSVEEKVLRVLAFMNTDSRKLKSFAEFALGNVRPDKRRQRVFCVKKLAKEVFEAFGSSLQEQKRIAADLSELPDYECPIRAYVIDWESIFANLITNAMWALGASPEPRRIKLTITPQTQSWTIRFEDSGFGLEAGTEDRVFDAGFSTKRNNRGETEGTGMGLFIVRNFVVENSAGQIHAECKGSLGGAAFTITVPRANATEESAA